MMCKCLKTLLIVCCALMQVIVGSRWAIAQYEAPAGMGTGSYAIKLAQYDNGNQYAQSNAVVDFDPPLIEHDVISEAEADIRQTFVATVVDDEELSRVVFFYRYAGETSFSRYVMSQVSFSSTYIAQIPTDPANRKAIEYYIEASDTSGNRTVRGYGFSPLVRDIIEPRGAESAAQQTQVEESTPVADEQTTASSGIPKIAYILGGLLVVGLIAGAAGSSGGGSATPPVSGGACGQAGCRLTVTVNRPY